MNALPVGGTHVSLPDRHRTRLTDGRPVSSASGYIKPTADAPLSRVRTFDGVSLFRFMREELCVAIAYSLLSLTAVAALRKVAKRLGLHTGGRWGG